MPEPYEGIIRTRAHHDMSRLPTRILVQVDECILDLGIDARPPGAARLADDDLWRVRVAGDYRVLYLINDETRTVRIARVVHRREANR